MDVKTTVLNGKLDDEVYMNMPGNEDSVCKLIKSLYGLKHAPKQWHQKFDEVVVSNGYLLNQANTCAYSKFDEFCKGVVICLYVDDMMIFGTDQVQCPKLVQFTCKTPASLKVRLTEMGEANGILGIRIKHESNGIAISQSHYIQKVQKKFNYFNCAPVSTPMDTSEKLMLNNSQVVSQLEYSRVTDELMYDMTYTEVSTGESEICALAAAGKEAEWLRNLILEIPLWSKPIPPISIRCDSAATLANAYSQMMCLEPAEKEDEVFTSQWEHGLWLLQHLRIGYGHMACLVSGVSYVFKNLCIFYLQVQTISRLNTCEGVDFRRWQKKMHFLLSSMSVVYVLTTPILEDGGDDATFACGTKSGKGPKVESVKDLRILEAAKYNGVEDASSKKFLVSNFTNYKMTDSRPVLE
ncbi:zinc finger, CCHC-type containing protein [Tanacetum coccineum]|uniref:Zinc finger, CCHC-type containing protein n=1 Tax=Tanacetum coccineum TaxID=301880 RepID=A0ABQ4YAP5_9ASTR